MTLNSQNKRQGYFGCLLVLPQHRLLTAMSCGRIELEKNIIRRERWKKGGAALHGNEW
jgi:hypothetical protein